jgi:hypothetical protein
MLNLEIMPVSKIHTILLLTALCSACVEPFEPVIGESQEVVVISGMVSDRPGRHTVTVSRSTPYGTPVFQPVEFCLVTVTDQDGNMIFFTEEGGGVYSADLPDSFLEVGDAVSLYVMTPDQKEYRSSYDSILPCPDIDSVYFERTSLETEDPEIVRPGIQFYLDMSGEPTDSRNILWQVDETWEYWASLIGNRLWLADGSIVDYKSNPLFRCWKHYPLDHFFTASTRNLSSNEMRRVALNLVTNETDRLSVTYSLNVIQQSLSSDAFNYFRRMEEQAVESGGLYGTQPASIPGNLYNVNDPGEVVLGYFHASQVHEKRIFVHNNNYFEFNIPHISCEFQPLSVIGEWPKIDYPIFIYWEGPFKPSWTALPFCFNCLIQGGDTIRPEYWESW